MAGKDMQDLYIGGEKITVPAWSTETTLSEVAGYSEATAKALTAMLKAQGKQGSVAKDNTKLFKNMLNAQKNTVKQAEDSAKQDKINAKNADKASKKELAELKKASDDRVSQVKAFGKAFNSQDLEGMTKAIAGAGALGIAAGLAVGTVVQFSKDLTEMSNIGVGFGDTLLELKAHSTATGLQLADYGKLIAGNLDGMLALGGTVHEGARIFSGLSKQIRETSSDFHQFGLSNTEMNQVIADEIELRRKSGMQQSLIFASVAGSMNDLMLETSALANITGQDRREVMRARNEAMNDEVTSAFLGTLDDVGKENVLGTKSIFNKLGAAGDTMFSSIFGGMASGLDADVVNSGALAKLKSLSPEIGSMISGIDNFITSNVGNENTPEYLSKLTAMVGQMQDSISADEGSRLATIALTNGAQAENARILLGIVRDTSGLGTDAAENEQEFIRTRIDMALSPLIGLGSAVEDTVVAMQLATLETVVGGFDTIFAKMMGDSDIVGATGSTIIGTLDVIKKAFTDTGLVGGANNLAEAMGIDTPMEKMTAAAVGLLLWLKSREGNGGNGGGGNGALGSAILGGGAGAAASALLAKKAKKKARRQAIILAAKKLTMKVGGGIVATSISAALTPIVATVVAAATAAQVLGVSVGAEKGIGTLEALDNEITPEQRQKILENQAAYTYPDKPTRATEVGNKTVSIPYSGVKPGKTGEILTGMTNENAWRHGERGEKFLQREQALSQETNLLLRRLITTVENN
jgi:hypothetical protein